MTDLGTLGGRSSIASAINEQGQIVGSSRIPSGEEHATLWTIKSVTPQQQIAALKAHLDELKVSGALNVGQHNALTTKLDGALYALAQHNGEVATDYLRAFVNQVNAFQKARILSSVQAQALRDAVTTLISALKP